MGQPENPKPFSHTDELKVWLTKGKDMGAKYMIIACDTWDYYDFAVFVSAEEDIRKRIEQLRVGRTIEVLAIFNLQRDLEPQLATEHPFFID